MNWDPVDQTVLANEQVLPDGTAERSGAVVEKRDLEQWYFRITDYAQQLLDDLDGLDWPERVITQQRNWIGRSEGAEFAMRIVDAAGVPVVDDEGELEFRVFTTRPDTSYGMTFCVLAPEHPLVATITTEDRRADVEAFVDRARRTSEIDRLSTDRDLARARVLHRCVRPQPLHRLGGADLPGRLRAGHLRHRRGHGGTRRGPARLGLRDHLRSADHRDRAASRRTGTVRRTAATVPT